MVLKIIFSTGLFYILEIYDFSRSIKDDSPVDRSQSPKACSIRDAWLNNTKPNTQWKYARLD